MIKKILFLIGIFFSTSVFASNIAIVNVEKIVQNSTAFKELNEELEKEKDSFQIKIKQKEIELSHKKEQIDSKSSLLSQETLQKQILDFQNEVLKFQEEIKNKEIELQGKLTGGLSKLTEEISNTVNILLKEDKFKNYSTVINSAALLKYNEEDDISIEILKRLNKKNISLVEKNKNKKK